MNVCPNCGLILAPQESKSDFTCEYCDYQGPSKLIDASTATELKTNTANTDMARRNLLFFAVMAFYAILSMLFGFLSGLASFLFLLFLTLLCLFGVPGNLQGIKKTPLLAILSFILFAFISYFIGLFIASTSAVFGAALFVFLVVCYILDQKGYPIPLSRLSLQYWIERKVREQENKEYQEKFRKEKTIKGLNQRR